MRIAPMLATAAEPFDSPDHLFEIKWDGIRALAAVQRNDWCLWGRGEGPYTERYPELDLLRKLPAGTVLDGELVRLSQEGRADFPAVLRRHQLVSARKIRWAMKCEPVTYMLFDLLQLGGKCLMKEPLQARRELLQQLVASIPCPPLRMSEGVMAAGISFFRGAAAQGHEGVMAKRLDSRYQPGRRSPAWRKIKPRAQTACLILGYRARRDGSIASLLLAGSPDPLHYLGEVRCRRLGEAAGPLAALLAERHCAQPFVPCHQKAQWVRPQLYCKVRYFGWTERGRLRFPTLVGLLDIEAP
jgi:DNA ligase-1